MPHYNPTIVEEVVFDVLQKRYFWLKKEIRFLLFLLWEYFILLIIILLFSINEGVEKVKSL